MLQHNKICGMPMIEGTSGGQVLNMRYIIEELISEDNNGCVYKAEDAENNANVLVIALPLYISLSKEQIEQLKESPQLLSSLENPDLSKIQVFDISGEVRYFIYEYSKASLNNISELRNNIINEIIPAKTDKTEDGHLIESYQNILSELQDKVNAQEEKFNKTLEKLDLNLNTEKEARKLLKEKQTDYKNIIQQLESKLASQQEGFNTALDRVELRFEKLIEEDQEVLNKNIEQEEILEKIKTETYQQQQKYARQLDKAQWKIEVLSTEIEKLLKKVDKNVVVREKQAPSKLKIALAAIVPLALGVIIGICGLYLYVNPEKTYKKPLKKLIPTLFSTEETDIIVSKEEPKTLSQADFTPQREEEKFDLLDTSEPVSRIAQEITKETVVQQQVIQDPNAVSKFEQAMSYYTGENAQLDYSKALELFEESANLGNTMAMYNAGRIYHQGSGIAVDGSKAIQWYEKAAQAGLPKAMNQLGQMYYFGDMVPRDYIKAAQYYEQAAKMDDLKAIYNLATLYLHGVGVERDIRKSMLWFIKAARKGDPDSMYQLGLMFETGVRIQKDIKKAAYWYQSAAEAGHKEAEIKYAKLSKS